MRVICGMIFVIEWLYTGRKGTYIINKNDTLKDILKRGKNNMNNDNELIKYLESIINTKLNKQQQK